MQYSLHRLGAAGPSNYVGASMSPTTCRSSTARLAAVAAVAAAIVMSLILWPKGSPAAPADRLPDVRRELSQTQRRGGVLASEVAAFGRRERTARARAAVAGRRRAALQRTLTSEQTRLRARRDRLAALKTKVRRLRAELQRQRGVLSRRLDASYRSDRPDAVTVILEADGFARILEDAAFLKRILRQDRRVLLRTRRLRDETARAEWSTRRLVAEIAATVRRLEARERELLLVEAARRRQQRRLQTAVAARSSALTAIRRRARRLEGDLGGLRREQARIEAAERRAAVRADIPAARSSLPTPTAPLPPPGGGGGGMLVPVDGPVSSPFGPRWGRLHAGLDISAPCGRPVRAATGGKVAMAGPNGGYGNYILLQQSASLATGYAHLQSLSTRIGASVTRGQVIGAVGNTGNSFGCHLHFEVRRGGTPVNPVPLL